MMGIPLEPWRTARLGVKNGSSFTSKGWITIWNLKISSTYPIIIWILFFLKPIVISDGDPPLTNPLFLDKLPCRFVGYPLRISCRLPSCIGAMPTEKNFRLQFAPASHQIKGLRQQRKHRLRLLRFMVFTAAENCRASKSENCPCRTSFKSTTTNK